MTISMVGNIVQRFVVATAVVSLLMMGGAWSAGAAPGPDEAKLRRFALVVSSNEGGSGRSRLRFADSDARSMAEVLRRLGGVELSDMVVLNGANRARLQSSLNTLAKQIGAAETAGQRREFIVYYSGHSNEEGLLLGNEQVSYRELRQWIDGMGAEVRIAVLDSCASGALIRLKGGVHRPPFLRDVSSDARGHAFLTASSADEAAQESDRLGAAFFTHYLLSGLRGAADSNRDGLVTLNEAYQFSYHETLRRTEKSQAGAQHATYDIQLAGTGDLVITDLRASNATLELGAAMVGHVYVRDDAGRLLVELRKEPGFPVALGLGAGKYRVVLDQDGFLFQQDVVLTEGKHTQLQVSGMKKVERSVAMARGGSGVGTLSEPAPSESAYRNVAFDIVIAPQYRLSGPSTQPVQHNFVLGLLGHSDSLRGVQLSLGGNIVEHDMKGVQLSTGLNMTGGPSAGLQWSGGANISRDMFRGVQNGIVNASLGDFRGFQTAIGNYATGSFHGVQLGVVNYSQSEFKGVQLGAINAGRGPRSGVFTSVVNTHEGATTGLQLAVVNVARETHGLQLAVLNVGDSIHGLQFGTVNVARTVRGGQFGIVNIARSVEGESFALLPLIQDGYHAVSLWSADTSVLNLGVKLGARHLYTLLGVGIKKDDADRTTYSHHIGFGWHTRTDGRWFLDLELVSSHFGNDDDFGRRASVLGTLRVVAGYRLVDDLAFIAGPSFNTEVSWDGKDFSDGLGFLQRVEHHGDVTLRQFPGFLVGMQY